MSAEDPTKTEQGKVVPESESYTIYRNQVQVALALIYSKKLHFNNVIKSSMPGPRSAKTCKIHDSYQPAVSVLL